MQPIGWNALPDSYRIPESAPSLAEARAYCERLAKSHYENFSVATWFLPARLRQHFYNVYSYCRISDDLGDEVGDAQQSLKHEFSDLLVAFRQDQTVTRFETFNDVLDYCRYSANPVGHLVLYLGGYNDAERQELSDSTCTALQLANFWQDVTVDFQKERLYLPLEDLRRFGVTVENIAARRCTPQFIEMMKFEVERARDWFRRGLPLIKMVGRELAVDLELFSRGGQEILTAIERQGYDVLKQRPVISKPRKLLLVARAAAGRLL